MQLTEHFYLPFPRVVVWAAFQKIDMLVQCLPGASLNSPAEERPLEMTFQLKMGPVVAAFAGHGVVTYEPASFCGNFSGQGTDRKNNSRVKGEASFTLLESEGLGTTVQLVVEFNLTGALAQFSRLGIIRGIAAGITAQFASNLQRELVASSETAGAACATAAPLKGEELTESMKLTLPVHSAAPPSTVSGLKGERPASLNLPALLWQLLVQRFKRLFK